MVLQFIHIACHVTDGDDGLFLLIGYFIKVTLHHLDCVKLSLLKASLDLLANIPLKLLEVCLVAIGRDEEHLVSFLALLYF